MTSIERIKEQRRAIVDRHTEADDVRGFAQVLTTLAALGALWTVVALNGGDSYWLTSGATLLMSLFLLRVFVLMHDCGHGSLFRSGWCNRTFGFLFGVMSGMPQYVWSQHHAYHHATNGNWAKYRGPLTTVSVEEYAAMTDRQRRNYRRWCSIWLFPVGGFLYVLWNPRFTWAKGSIALLGHMLKGKIARPGMSIKAHAAEFKTPYWASAREYWHMFWNNVVLLGACILMSWIVGPLLFLVVFVVSASLAGGAGIVLFTVQHNFEHSYASGDEGWDYVTAVVEGTSFLVLPKWLNWFTASIGYHHIHHLSAKIPNYRLADCHNEHQHLFSDVIRIGLSGVPGALKCILWDTGNRRIISVAEYERQKGSYA